MTQSELAQRVGRPLQAVNEIVNGVKCITAETAIQLERALGVPAYFWLGWEADYQFIKAKEQEASRLESEVSLSEQFPYKEMCKKGWVPKVETKVEKVRELQSYFGVASLLNVESTLAPAFRKSQKYQSSPHALAAWLRQGEIRATQMRINPFSKEKLQESIPRIRSLRDRDFASARHSLEAVFSDAGVVFCIVQHIPGTYVQGAAWWQTPEKPVIQISLRYKTLDVILFSLLHELGHILIHGKKDVFVDEKLQDSEEQKEREADNFAADILIPAANWNEFTKKKPSVNTIVRFAKNQGIDPAIVVGRLQHEGKLRHSQFNDLKPQLA